MGPYKNGHEHGSKELLVGEVTSLRKVKSLKLLDGRWWLLRHLKPNPPTGHEIDLLIFTNSCFSRRGLMLNSHIQKALTLYRLSRKMNMVQIVRTNNERY